MEDLFFKIGDMQYDASVVASVKINQNNINKNEFDLKITIMADVNPAEVSAILKKQLAGYSSAYALDEVGTVFEVGDGIARVYGLSNAQYGELVSFDNGP